VSELLTTNWVDVEAAASRTDIALIPLGAVEVYGPHMPQGTDGIVATALCRQLAARVDCLVAPLIPVGYSAMLASFPGTLSVPPAALVEYCRGVVESLFAFGIRRVLFVNGHAGNVQPIDVLCRDLSAPDRKFAQVDIWRYIQPFTADILDSTEVKFGHAGEAMTSVMLYLHPEYVRMERASKQAMAVAASPLGLSFPRSYREMAPDGLLGDAAIASAEKGKRIVDATVDELERFVRSEDFSLAGEGAVSGNGVAQPDTGGLRRS
jgi:creatinine amidohydrolase